jgi:hypothetical protein
MGNKKSPAKVNIDTASVDQMTQDTLRNLEFKPVQSDRNEGVESVKNAKDSWGENKFNAEEILGSIKSFHNDATANQRMKGSEEEGLWGPLTEAQKERRAGRRERRQLRDESRAKKIKFKNIARKEKVQSKIAEKEKKWGKNKKVKRGKEIVSAILQNGFIEKNIQTGSQSSISSNEPNPWVQGYKQGKSKLENLQNEVNKLKGAPKALGSPAKLIRGNEIRRRLGLLNTASSVGQGNLTNTADPYKDINPALNTRNQLGAIENLPPSGTGMGITFGETVGQSSYNSGTPDIMGTGGPRSSIRMEGAFANPYFNNSPNAPRGGQRRANQMFGSTRSRQMCMNLGKIKK